MSKKQNNSLDKWSNYNANHKIKVTRYFLKDDTNRKTPYIFDGWRKDFLTGEKFIVFHTKKDYDEELEMYASFVLPYQVFADMFDGVEVEI